MPILNRNISKPSWPEKSLVSLLKSQMSAKSIEKFRRWYARMDRRVNAHDLTILLWA